MLDFQFQYIYILILLHSWKKKEEEEEEERRLAWLAALRLKYPPKRERESVCSLLPIRR